jgi:hypothetical protein
MVRRNLISERRSQPFLFLLCMKSRVECLYTIGRTTKMAKEKEKSTTKIQRPDSDAMNSAQAENVGVDFRWHYGRVTRMGTYDVFPYTESRRTVTVIWEEGGLSCQHGEINDDQWEILKMAFMSTGMITVLSDLPGEEWMYDLRFLEAVR